MKPLLLFGLLFVTVKANPFLDIYFHVHPFEEFCTSATCNITYASSMLVSQNRFDLQSLKLQEGRMSRNTAGTFEDNTVFRLNKDMFHELDKIYLGLSLFDVPESMQDYIIVDVTNVVNKGHKARVEFVTETVRVTIHVYKRHEAMLAAELDDKHIIELDTTVQDAHNVSPFEDGCSCRDVVCSCCRHLKIRKVGLDDVVCVNTTYAKTGLHTALAVSGQAPQYSKESLTGNTRPICFGMLHREFGTLCLRIYNFERREHEISFCSEVEARLYHVKVARKKIGCLRVAT